MSGRSQFQAWLSATAGRRRRAALWRGGAAGTVALAGALALAATADRILSPSGWALVALAFASLLLAAAMTGILLWRASRREPDARVAALADQEQPEFQDRVKTAVDLMHRPEPGVFDDLVLGETTQRVSAADLPITNDDSGARRGMRLAAAAALALVIALAAAWPTLRDAGTTAGILMFPGSMELSIEPGDARVPIGKSMTITARAARLPRSFGRDLPVLTIVTDGGAASGDMPAGDDSAFSYVTPPITQSFTYKVAFGSATSRDYRVQALPYASVDAIDLSYRYPAWSGLPPREEKDAGDVYGPEGTRVTLTVRFDKPAREAALIMADGSRVPLAASKDASTFATSLTLAKDSAYRIEVRDVDDLVTADGTEYFIRLMDDAPPDVRIVRPAGDQRVTALAEVAVEARADDDHGVRGLELVYSVRGQGDRVVPLGGGGERSASGRHLIYLEDLGVKPGDFVSFHARARDVARGKQSTEGRSDIFFLEVKPFEEEFAAAQSMAQAGAGAASRQLQSLAAAQKEIIVATWKLERRSGAGRSSADLKAVGQAQRELKQRTAQAAAQAGASPVQPGRRGRRGGAQPPNPAAAQSEEASPAVLLTRAGEAMERATTELDAGRPKTALDHENEALNELLRIEAQIRRREIMMAQQQAAGGGGGQTGTQDLSALFDRELQRQQQTNYENRANARANEQQQQQEQESEALRRVREMAQRQEALRREQEEVARANMTAEERQRRLERLRRDQEQLQRQVEQLARRLQSETSERDQRTASAERSEPGQQGKPGEQGQQAQGRQGQQPGQSGRSGQSSQAGQADDASRAMSEAAGSLGREDLDRAREQSARAADALRNLEREMRNRERGGDSRAMNDARLEAQRLAEAQRRLAEDAARVSRSGAAAPDAARRLAGEKERIAERLDALGRRLDQSQQGQRQGSQGDRRAPGSNQSDQLAREAAASARRLAREQRAGAEAWREGQGGREGRQGREGQAGRNANPTRLAEGESRAAADLEQLARRLGAPPSGAGEADARRLANELDAARAARERLADLERQINDLRRQAESGRGGQRGEQDASRRLEDLQREFGREAQRARELANRQGGQQANQQEGADNRGRDNDRQDDGRRGTPEEAWSPSRSAPGTQQWKQDFSKWESMRKGVAQALEEYEASLTAKLAEQLAAERVHAGYDAQTPEAWRKLVADYYEAIAKRRSR